jgi:hypothetical protein
MKPILIFTPDKNYEPRFKAHRPSKPEDRLDMCYDEDPPDNAVAQPFR